MGKSNMGTKQWQLCGGWKEKVIKQVPGTCSSVGEGALGRHSKEKALKAGVRRVFQVAGTVLAEARRRRAARCLGRAG